MKVYASIHIMLLLGGYSSNSLSAQVTSARQVNNISMNHTTTKTDETILSELNAQFIKNFLTQDTISHSKLIHRDFICIEGSGEIVPRERYLKNWATDYDNSGYITFGYTDEVIRIFGNMALIRSKTVFTKIADGKPVEGNTIYTDTYIKENGKWMCVQAHITPIKK